MDTPFVKSTEPRDESNQASPHAVSEENSEIRVLACVAAHYVADRVQFLRQAVTAIAAWPAAQIHVVVLTNTNDAAEIAALQEASCVDPDQLTGNCFTSSIKCIGGLDDPFALVWFHREIMDSMFLSQPDKWTHFVYLEDDMVIPGTAFSYFVKYRRALSAYGLIPAFLRVESADDGKHVMATDQLRVTLLEFFRQVRAGDYIFTNMDNPYNACFIVDQELADEYVRTRSASIVASLQVKPNWGIRERAAMGLMFEQVPRFFWSRFVVPVHPTNLRIPTCAWVWHAPGNYARDLDSIFARLPVNDVLVRSGVISGICRLARAAWRRFHHRIPKRRNNKIYF